MNRKPILTALFLSAFICVSGCTNSEHTKLLGTWIRVDNGIEEITFNKDNTVIRKAYTNKENDFEEVTTYKIANGILLMGNDIIDYVLLKNNLILSWGCLYSTAYTRNDNAKNVLRNKKLLTGTWVFSAKDETYEFEFMKNDMVNIRGYKDSGIIRDKSYSYTITDYFIHINDLDIIGKLSYDYYTYFGLFLYRLEKDTLLMWEYQVGEIATLPIFLERKGK